MSSTIPPDELADIKRFWEESVETAVNQNTQAFFGGRNYRLNIFRAFKTAYHVTVTVIKVQATVLVGAVTPCDIFDIAESTYSALANGLQAISEELKPLHYLACVVLGSEDDGLTAAEWDARLRAFVAKGQTSQDNLPWYLRVSKERLARAANDLATLKTPESFAGLTEALRKGGWVEEVGGKFTFTSRHIEWGFNRV